MPPSLPEVIQNFLDYEGDFGILLNHGYNEDENELKGIDRELQPILPNASRENVIVCHEVSRFEGYVTVSAAVFRCNRTDWNWMVEEEEKPEPFSPVPIFSLIPHFDDIDDVTDTWTQQESLNTGNSALPEEIKNVYFRKLLVFRKDDPPALTKIRENGDHDDSQTTESPV